MKKLFLLLMSTLPALSSFAQDKHLVDSLETRLKNLAAEKLELRISTPSQYDTALANTLAALSAAYWTNNPDKAMDYAGQCLALSEQIGYKKGMGDAYNLKGVIECLKGNYLPALEFDKKALELREETGNKKDLASSYNNMGIVYLNQGNYPEALKNWLTCLKIGEEIGNKNIIATSYNNIGNVYKNLENYPEALKNFSNALLIYKETGYKNGISSAYGNIANIYRQQGNYPEALKNNLICLKIQEETGNKRGIADSYGNIGNIYSEQGKEAEALKNYLAGLKIQEELGDKQGIASVYGNIGGMYTKEKKYDKASDYLNKTLSLAKEIGSLDYIKEAYKGLAELDSARGNLPKALEDYKLFITYRDSLLNNENTKKITQQQMQYDFDKKESITKAGNEKELQKQKLVRNGFMGGFAVVLLFAGVFFRQRNKTTREKKRSEDLLLNILPGEVAEEIKTTGTAKTKAYTLVTVMFTDFKDFTTVSEKVSAELLVEEIHTCFSAFDHILQKYKIEKIKTIGDAYLCAGGLPVSNYTHAVDMLHAAFEIRDYMLQRKKEKKARGEIPFELRIGIHTGPVVAGIVGVKKYAYDIWGDTVNLAARMEQHSEAGKINISGSTYELVKDKFSCTHRGKIQAKNKGEIDMYFVESVS